MNKHTPGPWKLDRTNWRKSGFIMHTVISKDCIIAPIQECLEVEANAQLISAAPELLEALEWAITQNVLPTGVKLDAAIFAVMKAGGKAK